MGRRRDIAGNEYGTLTAVRRVGTTAARQAVWSFSCSQCGKTNKFPAYKIIQGKTKCRCQFPTEGAGISSHPAYASWMAWKNRAGLVSEWSSLEAFATECWSKVPDGLVIFRPDDSKPLGPKNVRIGSRKQRDFEKVERVVSFLVATEGVTEEAARSRIASVSRQRLWQLDKKATGRCFWCGKKKPQKTKLCNKCSKVRSDINSLAYENRKIAARPGS